MANSPAQRIRLFVGDITSLDVDAVVTAANQSLAGGGGVDGAVHAAAGHELLKASRALAPCPPGNARMTPGFRLRSQYAIHAVGPIFRNLSTDSTTLSATYRSALRLASEQQLQRVAFPCISTGVYGFPAEQACKIAVGAVIDWLDKEPHPEIVVFCCYDDANATLYRDRLGKLGCDLPHL